MRMSKGKGINRKKLVPFILSIIIFYKIRCRGFLKNRRNGDHAEGTAAEVTFCLPGVQRTGSPLCLDCKGC